MHQHPIQLLDLFYRWLNQVIHDYGEYLYLGLVLVSLLLIAWILSGGLRRRIRQSVNSRKFGIIVVPSTVQPPPPLLCGETGAKRNPPDDDIQSFCA
jgi:hypothetical protein